MRKQSKVVEAKHDSVRGWTQWKEPQARAVLLEWERSGLSAESFARERDISSMRLWYWRKRLRELESRKDKPVAFVAVSVPGSSTVPRAAQQIEIEREGVVVRVREDLDVEHVARLVSALAAGRAC